MSWFPDRLLAAVLASPSIAAAGCGGGRDVAVTAAGANPVALVSVIPATLTLHSGAQTRLAADPRDVSGAAVGNVAVTWMSTAPLVAQVAGDGTVTGIAPGSATIIAQAGGRTGSAQVTVDAVYDLELLGVPRIVTQDYIEVDKITRVSRFRSGVGHDYADDAEQCRSMKHYFQPLSSVDWGKVVIASPIDGTVASLADEQTYGTQVRLTPTALPAVTVVIFHLKPDMATVVGARVVSGARLGTHIGPATMSDIAIFVATPRGRRLVSYFDAMTDSVFAGYHARGVASRATMVIPASERDASPLGCNGEAFLDAGTIANWVVLP